MIAIGMMASGTAAVFGSGTDAAAQTGDGVTLSSGLAIGVAMGLLPLLIAYWPRIVARLPHGVNAAATPTQGITPFIAAVLSGLSATGLLACGLMWVIARTPHRAVAAATPAEGSGASREPAESGAEGYLRESLRPPGSIDYAGEAAATTISGTNPTSFEAALVMAGLRACASDDARGLGLLRNADLWRKLLLIVAGLELLATYLISGSVAAQATAACACLVTAWAALHIDTRSFSGARLSGYLRRLRASLRTAALTADSLDAPAMRGLVPAATDAAELEVWAVAVGCRTPAFERAASRMLSTAQAASGRPKRIRYTEMVILTGGQVAHSVTAPIRAVLHIADAKRRARDGAAPILW